MKGISSILVVTALLALVPLITASNVVLNFLVTTLLIGGALYVFALVITAVSPVTRTA